MSAIINTTTYAGVDVKEPFTEEQGKRTIYRRAGKEHGVVVPVQVEHD